MVTVTCGFRHRRDPLNDFGISEVGDSPFTEFNFT